MKNTYPSQPLQTKIKQFRIAITFPTPYNGIFNDATKRKMSISHYQITMMISKR